VHAKHDTESSVIRQFLDSGFQRNDGLMFGLILDTGFRRHDGFGDGRNDKGAPDFTWVTIKDLDTGLRRYDG